MGGLPPPRRRAAMWNTLENVFYVAILLLFLTTFLPRRVRTHVRESLSELWRVLPHLWRVLEPYAYRLVTGRPPPKDDAPATAPRCSVEMASIRRPAVSRDTAGDEFADEPGTEPFADDEPCAAH